MKKLNIYNIFLIAAILCSSVSMNGMEQPMPCTRPEPNPLMLGCVGFMIFTAWTFPAVPFLLAELYKKSTCSIRKLLSTYEPSEAKENEEYNDYHCLLINMLPPEPLSVIFSHCLIQNDLSVVAEDHVKSLENSIKTLMKLSCTCKSFNKLLTYEKMGNFCKSYSQHIKNMALENLMYVSTVKDTYNIKRSRILILVYAGIDTNYKFSSYKLDSIPESERQQKKKQFLLQSAAAWDDAQAVAILLKHHADPNTRDSDDIPVFFGAKTTEIAQLFFDHGADLNSGKRSVLWRTCYDDYSSDLIPFYIQHGADLSCERDNGYCLLHALAGSMTSSIKDSENFFKKAELLLNTIPEKINNLLITKAFMQDGNEERTPLDIARNHFCYNVWGRQRDQINEFITLLRKHGALTAKELKEGKSHEQSTCTIF